MKTRFVIVMGVAGCGKTTVGEALARHLGWQFYDADAFIRLRMWQKWRMERH
jgi:shikimate kinase